MHSSRNRVRAQPTFNPVCQDRTLRPVQSDAAKEQDDRYYQNPDPQILTPDFRIGNLTGSDLSACSYGPSSNDFCTQQATTRQNASSSRPNFESVPDNRLLASLYQGSNAKSSISRNTSRSNTKNTQSYAPFGKQIAATSQRTFQIELYDHAAVPEGSGPGRRRRSSTSVRKKGQKAVAKRSNVLVSAVRAALILADRHMISDHDCRLQER